MGQILWGEKLINVQHIENDIKVYEFYKKLFSRNAIIEHGDDRFVMLLGDRVQLLANYYFYCYRYTIRFTGEREISVGVIDWGRQAYVTAEIICGIYPRKVYKKKDINTRPMRTVVSIRHCTTLDATYTSDSARPHIEALLDEIVTIFKHDYIYHENKLQQTVLRRFGVCLSIRLTQLLKYAVHLQTMVKQYCYSNCIFYDRIYDDVDKWLFETHCDLDESNCIISVYMTMKDLGSSAYSHCLACLCIKYGHDECEEGVYKRSVGYRIEYCNCEHDISCFLRFNDLYGKIFLYIYENVCVGFDIVGVEDYSVIRCVEMYEQNYSVLISRHLVLNY